MFECMGNFWSIESKGEVVHFTPFSKLENCVKICTLFSVPNNEELPLLNKYFI